MIKPLLRQRNKELPVESRHERIPRAVIGALIGFLSFILLTTSIFFNEPSWAENSYLFVLHSVLQLLVILLLSPGMLVLRIIYSTSVSEAIFAVIVFGVSSIPFTVFGFLAASNDQPRKKAGKILLIVYGILLIIGLPLWGVLWTS